MKNQIPQEHCLQGIFFESIKVKNGKIYNIEFHNERVHATMKAVFGLKKQIQLEDYIIIPDDEFYKCRIEYNTKVISVQFIEYTISKKKSFKLVVIGVYIDYKHKTIERNFIEKALTQKGDCDDIIMMRGGFLTDSSVANIACYIDGKWITPKNPLSKGTTRKRLLKTGKILEGNIEMRDIKKIKKFALMNALFGFMEIEGFEIIM